MQHPVWWFASWRIWRRWAPTKARLWVDDARAVTKAQPWSNPLIRSLAGVVVAVLTALALGEREWQTYALAVAAGISTFIATYALTFIWNLIRAPKRVNKIYARPPLGSKVLAQMFVNGKVNTIDVMQADAVTIANTIGRYLERRARPGLVEQPRERQEIQDQIARFGERARTDRMITRKSRQRSLELHEAISTLDDLEAIRSKCLAFRDLKPSR